MTTNMHLSSVPSSITACKNSNNGLALGSRASTDNGNFRRNVGHLCRRQVARPPRAARDLRTSVRCERDRSDHTDCDSSPHEKLQKALTRPLVAALAAIQMLAPVSPLLPPPPPAHAILSSPKRDLPRTVEAALRRSIPMVSGQTKDLQASLENIFYLLRIPQRKPFGQMEVDVEKAIKMLDEENESLLAIVPDESKVEAAKLLDDLNYKLTRLQISIQTKDPDRVSIRVSDALQTVSDLAILQAPGLPYLVPGKFAQLPRLTGRATVELTVMAVGDNRSFTIYDGNNGTLPTAKLRLELDGYSAPLTAGHFAAMVNEGYFKGMPVRAGESSFVLGGAGSPASPTPTGTLPLPLELLPAGDFAPLYNTNLDIYNGEMPSLPLSVYGAVAMGHGPDNDSDPTEVFLYLFDRSQAGLGGLSFDEGTFAVFGYITEGRDLLRQIRPGDVITSAKIIKGANRLVMPEQ